MSNAELITSDFLTEAARHAEHATTAEQLRAELKTAVAERQQLLILKERLQSIDVEIQQADVHLFVIRQRLSKTEEQQQDAFARCEQMEPRRAGQ